MRVDQEGRVLMASSGDDFLEQRNAELAGLIEELRGAESEYERSREIAIQLNERLLAAIYRFPHLARSVEVVLSERVDWCEGDTVYEQFEGVMEWWRCYRGYAIAPFPRLYEAAHGEPFSGVVRVPLGYVEPTGEPFSAERIIEGTGLSWSASFDVVAYPRSPRFCRLVRVPIRRGSYSLFGLDEIKGVRFSQREDLTPELVGDMGNESLQPRPTPIRHYLEFRMFFVISRHYEKDLQASEGFRQEQWDRLGDLLLYPHVSVHPSLWYEMWRTKDSFFLKHGFIVRLSNGSESCEPGGMKLYELAEVPLPFTNPWVREFQLGVRCNELGTEAYPGTSVFCGWEIVEKLAQIPVQRRRL